MGVHINIIHKSTFEKHPEWNHIRQAGDNEIVVLLCEKMGYKEEPFDAVLERNPPYRPSDFDKWRKIITSLNKTDSPLFEIMKKRLAGMLIILETDQDYGIHISY